MKDYHNDHKASAYIDWNSTKSWQNLLLYKCCNWIFATNQEWTIKIVCIDTIETKWSNKTKSSKQSKGNCVECMVWFKKSKNITNSVMNFSTQNNRNICEIKYEWHKTYISNAKVKLTPLNITRSFKLFLRPKTEIISKTYN